MTRLLRWFLLLYLGIGLSIGLHFGLGKSLAISPSFANPSLSPPSELRRSNTPHALVQAGKALYDAQRYTEANPVLSEAAQTYEEMGDRSHQAQTLALQSLVLQKLGEWDAANDRLEQSLALLASLAEPPLRIRAQVFNAQGHLYFFTGQTNAALTSWTAAEQDYKAVDELSGAIGSEINQMQALESMGFYHLADEKLQHIEAQLQTLPASIIKLKAILSLADVLRLQGELSRSQAHLTNGLAIAQTLQLSTILGDLYLTLGNTERLAAARAIALKDTTVVQAHTQLALEYYQQAVVTTPSPLTQSEAYLNQLSLLIQRQDRVYARLQRPPSSSRQYGHQTPTPPPVDVLALIATIHQTLPQLIPSRGAVYAQINFAHSLMQLNRQGGDAAQALADISVLTILERAIRQAEALADERAIAYAMGALGRWHETRQEWTAAKQLTNTALQKAQLIRAPDIAYQWQWQMGRIIQAEADVAAPLATNPLATNPHQSNAHGLKANDTKAISDESLRSPSPDNVAAQATAIRYYTGAVDTLDILRSDLVALNPDVQFSFREQVEPVYRELVDLLLREKTPSQAKLRQARKTIEALQLAELDNFFRDACAQPQAVDVETVDPNAAVLYTILLGDSSSGPGGQRLEVVLQLPERVSPSTTGLASNDSNQSAEEEPKTSRLLHIAHPFTEGDVVQVATALQQDLRRVSVPTGQIQANAQQLYDWMIRPFEDELDLATQREDSPIKTLVFVLDGPLRNLPMAVLHDGDRYLVERYAIAVNPGLQLLDPQPLQRQNLNVLLGGAVDAPSFEQFALGALANVERELEGIRITLADSQTLQDQAFTQTNIQNGLETTPFNVIHFATHGNFSSNPEQTFILDWQQAILAKDIDRLLSGVDPQRSVKQPIELLILSACETAAGDNRAALGLAGIAIRAGARSTLATLWQVNDSSTAEFMVRFYRELTNPQVTKADALRTVQLSFLHADPMTRYPRPNRWAPFILVGNWL